MNVVNCSEWSITSGYDFHENFFLGHPSVKHSGGSILLYGWFGANVTGDLHRIYGIMKMDDYLQILQDNLKSSSWRLALEAVGSSNSTMTPNPHQK